MNQFPKIVVKLAAEESVCLYLYLPTDDPTSHSQLQAYKRVHILLAWKLNHKDTNKL